MPRKYMEIREFVESGFLQELNRQFLHPLGLALEVTEEDDGTYRLSGVWDQREDPEGIVFAEVGGVAFIKKADNVRKELERHRAARTKLFGSVVQDWGS